MRDRILKELKNKKINLNKNPVKIFPWKYLSKNKVGLWHTDKVCRGIFSLPLYPELKFNELKKITHTLKKILAKF